MQWITQRVWQLGLAILLILAGAWLVYANRNDANSTSNWIGLAMIFIALAVPLVSGLFQSNEDQKDEA